MRKLCLVLPLVMASALAPRAAEPCSLCQCGDPAFAFMGSQLFVPRTWHLGLSADRYAKDQVAEDDPGTREKEVENRVTLSASRTFADRLTLVARLPFAQRNIMTSSEEQSLSGLSDPELTTFFAADRTPPAGRNINYFRDDELTRVVYAADRTVDPDELAEDLANGPSC